MSKNYVNLNKDAETVRLTVLANICRMMVRRGVLDINKHKLSEGGTSKEGKLKQVSKRDIIDNNSFLQFIEKRTENSVYIIPLDNHFKHDNLRSVYSESESTLSGTTENEKIEFDGSKLVVKIIPQKITDITNSHIIKDFLRSYAKYHKIMVFDGIAEKAYSSIRAKHNLEGFTEKELMIDLMSHMCAPDSASIINENDLQYIINPKFSKMHENDPLSRYYYAKKGEIMRIVRVSANNSLDVGYRRIIEAKPIFK